MNLRTARIIGDCIWQITHLMSDCFELNISWHTRFPILSLSISNMKQQKPTILIQIHTKQLI